MDANDFIRFVQKIVEKANDLKNRHTPEEDAPVNYACIFCQNDKQYENLVSITQTLGRIIKETPMGPLFHIQPIDTIAGKLQLLKIRKPDATRQELGDADFTVSDYPEFKKKHLNQEGFSLIVRASFEMIELAESGYDVRAYFSHPPLTEQLGIE